MINHVFVLKNGMVGVFDENDKQMPEYQGIIFEVMPKIGKDATTETKFTFSRKIDVSWWFKK